MCYDYYAFKKAKLSEHIDLLEQANKELKEAKKLRDKHARKQASKGAENKIKSIAIKVVENEPHLAYLLYEANQSELKNSVREAWQNKLTVEPIPQSFQFLPDQSAITCMPRLSFFLRLKFKLYKPYISKDDTEFYLLDNPVRKDKVFQNPMVGPTSWKGALRTALWQLGYSDSHESSLRLFGNSNESDEQQAGRLYFYPTFFDQIGLEVINPHSRETGVGERGPIMIECVPQDATGELCFVYIPLGSATEQNSIEQANEIAHDLEVLCQGIQAMLTVYGFGAKTSSGFGTAEDLLPEEGILSVRAALNGLVSKNHDLSNYHQHDLSHDAEKLPVTEYKFQSLGGLVVLAQDVATKIRYGGEG